jgi:hypothetical protein
MASNFISVTDKQIVVLNEAAFISVSVNNPVYVIYQRWEVCYRPYWKNIFPTSQRFVHVTT